MLPFPQISYQITFDKQFEIQLQCNARGESGQKDIGHKAIPVDESQ